LTIKADPPWPRDTITASAIREKWDGLRMRGLVVFLTQEKLSFYC
jgi:hypothetical protein